MHDDKELIDLLQEEGFLEEVKVENIDSDNATQGEVLMADGSGGAEWSEIEAGIENPMTAKDDLIIGGTDGAPARLAKGTNGQVLQVGSDGLEWATPSGGGEIPFIEVPQGTTSVAVDSNYTAIINALKVNDYFYLKQQTGTNQFSYISLCRVTEINTGTDVVYFSMQTFIYKDTSSSDSWYGSRQSCRLTGAYYFTSDRPYFRLSGPTYRFTRNDSILFSSINLDQNKFNALYCQKDAPDTDGTYVLKCTVSSGVKTYTWVSE